MAQHETRAAWLLAQTHCPACGKPRIKGEAFGQAGLSAEVRFACGGAVATFGNLPIQSARVCPSPMYVAAAGLEDAFVAGQVGEGGDVS